MNASRRGIRNLNLSAANRHLFSVNTLLTAQMLGLSTQAQSTRDAKHVHIPINPYMIVE